jgi:bidirectional [NiFe] hydrogenase diaphorase subunit
MSASPPAATVKDNREKLLERAMSRHQYSGDALIEVLHTAQELYGFLPPALLKTIARKLRLPPSRVLGVATFYHFFSLQPKAAHTFVVCLGTACYVAGALGLVESLNRRCGKPENAGVSKDVSVETARCIGSCGLAPAVIFDGKVLARVTPKLICAELESIGVK